jgi:hypothetical protein
MAKWKFSPNQNPSLDEVESLLDGLTKVPQKEIPFNYVKKIAEYLGCEYLKGKSTGSKLRFRHDLLDKYSPLYLNGLFGIHIVHKGKNNLVIMRANYKTYLYPPLKEIIQLKRETEKV